MDGRQKASWKHNDGWKIELMDLLKDAQMDKDMDGQTDRWMDELMDRWTDIQMDTDRWMQGGQMDGQS